MKITIGNPVPFPKLYTRCYKFVIKFMIGDADGYNYVTLYLADNHPNLIRFIKFLQNCKKAYPYGRGGRDDYNEKKVKDWNYFIESEGQDDSETDQEDFDWENPIYKSFIYFEWPHEPGSSFQCSYEDFTLTYFDFNGQEFEVEVK